MRSGVRTVAELADRLGVDGRTVRRYVDHLLDLDVPVESARSAVGPPIGAPAGPRDTRGLDFFENILPEGPALERMAALAVVLGDTYGILAAFGRDCAGPIMVILDGDGHGGNGGSGYSPMTPGDLQRVIGALDVTPLAVAPERCLSLARLPAQGSAGPGRRQHLAAAARGRSRLPGSSDLTAPTR